ncbi:hypothetical protein ABKN59_005609 [Abortiporus biennis]
MKSELTLALRCKRSVRGLSSVFETSASRCHSFTGIYSGYPLTLSRGFFEWNTVVASISESKLVSFTLIIANSDSDSISLAHIVSWWDSPCAMISSRRCELASTSRVHLTSRRANSAL